MFMMYIRPKEKPKLKENVNWKFTSKKNVERNSSVRKNEKSICHLESNLHNYECAAALVICDWEQ